MEILPGPELDKTAKERDDKSSNDNPPAGK